MIQGAAAFIKALAAKGLSLYIASGTDHEDVIEEAEVLGVRPYFRRIAGAPHKRKDCSKEAVIRELLEHKDMDKRERLVKAGAYAIAGDYLDYPRIMQWLGL